MVSARSALSEQLYWRRIQEMTVSVLFLFKALDYTRYYRRRAITTQTRTSKTVDATLPSKITRANIRINVHCGVSALSEREHSRDISRFSQVYSQFTEQLCSYFSRGATIHTISDVRLYVLYFALIKVYFALIKASAYSLLTFDW